MNTRPISLSIVRLRKTSPQAQWKNCGMVPRILPWVPLPAPGAPKRRIVRYFIGCWYRRSEGRGPPALVLRVLVLQLNLFDFRKRVHDFLGRVAFADLHVKVVGRNARNTFGGVLAARGF